MKRLEYCRDARMQVKGVGSLFLKVSQRFFTKPSMDQKETIGHSRALTSPLSSAGGRAFLGQNTSEFAGAEPARPPVSRKRRPRVCTSAITMFLTAVALCVTNVPAQNLQTQSQSQFRNVGPQVQYPDWFSNPKITPDDRQRLMALYNLREWMAYMDSLNLASEPQIRTSDGRVLRLQPFLDVLFAVAGVSNPAASQVKSGNVREGVVIKQRAGREMDTPSAEETPNNSDIET